jgi:hypothetical protein
MRRPAEQRSASTSPSTPTSEQARAPGLQGRHATRAPWTYPASSLAGRGGDVHGAPLTARARRHGLGSLQGGRGRRPTVLQGEAHPRRGAASGRTRVRCSRHAPLRLSRNVPGSFYRSSSSCPRTAGAATARSRRRSSRRHSRPSSPVAPKISSTRSARADQDQRSTKMMIRTRATMPQIAPIAYMLIPWDLG